ncbi:tyrosine--tRNA ligase [Malassezia nana]|uniref:Tyrosine--tRNA ligase n=1 Tax=Malassezia nana TaxID=180528 RepID=A0AAF0EQN1_9BASI|nr:tyrosine--tRNA ligase [Malassezia nana]
MLSDFDFYQYFLRSADADVERYLLALTLLSHDEIQEILKQHNTHKAKRIAQTRLAEEVTELVRGEEALRRARVATQTLFGMDVHSLSLEQVQFAFMNDPRLVYVPRGNVDILRLAADVKLVASRSEARRLVQQGGGLYVNNTPVRDVNAQLDDSCLLDHRFVVMRAGRSNHKIVVFT